MLVTVVEDDDDGNIVMYKYTEAQPGPWPHFIQYNAEPGEFGNTYIIDLPEHVFGAYRVAQQTISEIEDQILFGTIKRFTPDTLPTTTIIEEIDT